MTETSSSQQVVTETDAEPPSAPKRLLSLRFRDLRGRDLSREENLTAWGLAGADLRGARLPDSVTFDLLERAQAASTHVQSTFLVLMTAVLFCWVVRLGAQDVEVAVGGAAADLPFLDYKVNLLYFYLLSPLLILIVYIYFHLALQQLLEVIVNLPKYFPDGLRIDKKMHPWPLLRFTELLFADLWARASYESKAKAALTGVLMWWGIPLSFIAYWLHYLGEHRIWMSVWHVALLGLSFAIDSYVIWSSMSIVIRSRREEVDNQSSYIGPAFLPEDTKNLQVEQRRSCLVAAAIGTLAVTLALGYTHRVIVQNDHRPRSITTLNFVGQSLRPTSDGSSLDSTVDLSDRDLDGLRGRDADLSRVSFRSSTLEGATLIGANLTHADFTRANLGQADLVGANLSGVDLAAAANLEGACVECIKCDAQTHLPPTISMATACGDAQECCDPEHLRRRLTACFGPNVTDEQVASHLNAACGGRAGDAR